MAPGAEKTVAEKQVVLVGRPALRFCNRHRYRGPDLLPARRGEGGRRGGRTGGDRYVIPHAAQREGTEGEGDVGALLPSLSSSLHPDHS